MIVKIDEAITRKLTEAYRDACESALDGDNATVWFDLRDGEIWTNYNDSGIYNDLEIVCVADVEPYSLEEVYGDDPNLEADPEGFREWYLNERVDNALNPRSYIEYWEDTSLKNIIECINYRDKNLEK